MNWLEPGFPWKAICTIDNSGLGALSDFPVRVQLDHLLAHDVDSLRFYDADGTLLDHEVDSTILMGQFWRAEAWVKIPSISAGLTTQWFSVYWGHRQAPSVENPTAVWDANFMGVWHLSERTGQYEDSTAAGHDSTIVQVTNRTQRKLGYHPLFDGIDDHVLVPDHNDFSFTDGAGNDEPCTVESFFRKDSSDFERMVTKYGFSAGANREWQLNVRNPSFVFYQSNNAANYIFRYGTNIIVGQWYAIAGTYTGSESHSDIHIFLDGSLADGASGMGGAYPGMSNTASSLVFGAYDEGVDGNYIGAIDEIRISDIVRSADWIEATSRCMHNTYVSISNPIGCPPRGLLTSSGPQTLIRRNPERRHLVKELDRFPTMFPFTPVAPESPQNKGDGT